MLCIYLRFHKKTRQKKTINNEDDDDERLLLASAFGHVAARVALRCVLCLSFRTPGESSIPVSTPLLLDSRHTSPVPHRAPAPRRFETETEEPTAATDAPSQVMRNRERKAERASEPATTDRKKLHLHVATCNLPVERRDELRPLPHVRQVVVAFGRQPREEVRLKKGTGGRTDGRVKNRNKREVNVELNLAAKTGLAALGGTRNRCAML